MASSLETPSFELGDRIYIAGGKLDGMRGRIYYLDEDKMKILPDGIQHKLETIPFVDGDFDPSLEIKNVYILQKRVSPAFVAQVDFQKDYLAETITDSGELGTTYKIQEINEDDDFVILVDETGVDKRIDFGFVGIPEDEEFVIVRVRQPPQSLAANNAKNAQDESVESGRTEEEEEVIQILDNLEIPEIYNIREIPISQRFYSDVIQRNDMLQDLLSTLDIKKQKNPQRQSELRKLVEQMLILRNEIVEYSKSGEPTNFKPAFHETLYELLHKENVALARPVADVKRVVYLDHSVKGLRALENDLGEPDPETTPYSKVKVQYLQDVVQESNNALEGIAGTQAQQVNPDVLPNWYLGWEGFYKRLMLSWEGTSEMERKKLLEDKEFLRAPVPDMEMKTGEGLPMLGKNEKEIVGTEDLGEIQFSLLRGLTGRQGRLRAKVAPREIESAETLPIESYLLFPSQYAADLGTTRSGNLAIDIGKSLMAHFCMEEILKIQEGVSNVPTADSILNVSATSFGNIAIEDWLRSQPLESHGFADILTLLSSYGLQTKELTFEQMKVLSEKMDAYRAIVRNAIKNIREAAAKELEEIRLENNTLLDPQSFTDILAKFVSEEIFKKTMGEFQARLPSYRENDIALFGYFFSQMYDLTLAVLSGKADSLQIEIRRKVRDEYQKRYQGFKLLREKKEMIGEVPQPNPCPHVKSLDMIRKVSNSSDRMRLLQKFITQFGGEKKDNWLFCQVCEKHCLCVHEVLQIQEFLRPREKDALHKELLLTFSEGAFQGKYLCRNCGQGIADLEFDTSIEFDDEGKPMMGRAVLVDEDALVEDQIEQALGAPVGTPEELTFPNRNQTEAYKTCRYLLDKIGIQFNEDTYRKVVQRVDNDIGKQKSPEDYAKYQKAQKAKGVSVPDYDVLRSRLIVCGTAAYTLIEIQTNIPGYVIRYKMPNCNAGFSGYPFGAETDKTGVEYLACAAAAITVKEEPWMSTGYLKETSVPKRQNAIATLIMNICRGAANNSDIKYEITLKKEYLEQTFGSQNLEGGLVETVPQGYLPEQKGKEEEKVDVVPEAASPREKARAWILQANDIAKRTVSLSSGRTFVEASCCFHSLQDPQDFWKATEKELVPLAMTKKSSGPRGSHLQIHFNPRKRDSFQMKVPEDILYRVFLKVCFDGPRRGLPHEPGYDNLCPHCGFTFPRNKEITSMDEGRIALDTQGVDYSQKEFQRLLDDSHRQYLVDPVVKKEPVHGIALMNKLLSLNPAPFTAWQTELSKVILEFEKLPQNKGVDELDLATIYGPLGNLAEEFKQDLIVHLGQENGRILEELVNQSPSGIVESLRSYFLVPFQRVLTGFHNTSLRVQKSYGLSEDTMRDLHEALDKHNSNLNEIAKRAENGTNRIKIEQVVRQLQVILPILQEEIRAPFLPGGRIGLPYFLQAIVFGIFAQFIDSTYLPPGITEEINTEVGDIYGRGLLEIANICLYEFKKEGLNFTTDQIRDMIARRNEMEKKFIINKFDKMSPERKAVELINKRLGLGDWSIGGTKLIYAYDKDQYERERVERLAMGLVDFAGGDGQPTAPEGREADETGIYNFGEGPAEDGYDMADMNEEDY